MKLYEVDLDTVMDMTHDEELKRQITKVLTDMKVNMANSYRPFEFSKFGIIGNKLYYPAHYSEYKYRLGTMFYEPSECIMTFDMTRYPTESLVVWSYKDMLSNANIDTYSKYDAKELEFILNMYRQGRSPLIELQSTKINNFGLLQYLKKLMQEDNSVPTEYLDGYIRQLRRMSQYFSKPIYNIHREKGDDVTVDTSPLLKIISEYLFAMNASSERLGSIEFSTNYIVDFHKKITSLCTPYSLLELYKEGMFCNVMLLEQMIASDSQLDKYIKSGAIKVDVGSPYDIQYTQNKVLLDTMKHITQNKVFWEQTVLGTLCDTIDNNQLGDALPSIRALKMYMKDINYEDNYTVLYPDSVEARIDLKIATSMMLSEMVSMLELVKIEDLDITCYESIMSNKYEYLTKEDSELYITMINHILNEEITNPDSFIVERTTNNKTLELSKITRITPLLPSSTQVYVDSPNRMYAELNKCKLFKSSLYLGYPQPVITDTDFKNKEFINPIDTRIRDMMSINSRDGTLTAGMWDIAYESTNQSTGRDYKLEAQVVLDTYRYLQKILSK